MIKPEHNHKNIYLTSTTVQQQSKNETASKKGQKNDTKGRKPRIEIRTHDVKYLGKFFSHHLSILLQTVHPLHLTRLPKKNVLLAVMKIGIENIPQLGRSRIFLFYFSSSLVTFVTYAKYFYICFIFVCANFNEIWVVRQSLNSNYKFKCVINEVMMISIKFKVSQKEWDRNLIIWARREQYLKGNITIWLPVLNSSFDWLTTLRLYCYLGIVKKKKNYFERFNFLCVFLIKILIVCFYCK